MSDDNCNDCLKVENVSNTVRGNTYSIQENTKAIRKVEDQVKDLNQNFGIDNYRIDSLFEMLSEIKDGIKDLTKAFKDLQVKPLEKYDKITVGIVTSVFSAMIGALITLAVLK